MRDCDEYLTHDSGLSLGQPRLSGVGPVLRDGEGVLQRSGGNPSAQDHEPHWTTRLEPHSSLEGADEWYHHEDRWVQ
jgi:hypothetical protein